MQESVVVLGRNRVRFVFLEIFIVCGVLLGLLYLVYSGL
jgi:hypothetical protein